MPAMDSFANVLLLLFRTFLGETMFDTMLTEKSTLYNLYGNIVVLVYTLAATVILANLLIAIISYHFKPEKVVPQSKFQDAEILKQYEYRVRVRLYVHMCVRVHARVRVRRVFDWAGGRAVRVRQCGPVIVRCGVAHNAQLAAHRSTQPMTPRRYLLPARIHLASLICRLLAYTDDCR